MEGKKHATAFYLFMKNEITEIRKKKINRLLPGANDNQIEDHWFCFVCGGQKQKISSNQTFKKAIKK